MIEAECWKFAQWRHEDLLKQICRSGEILKTGEGMQICLMISRYWMSEILEQDYSS